MLKFDLLYLKEEKKYASHSSIREAHPHRDIFRNFVTAKKTLLAMPILVFVLL